MRGRPPATQGAIEIGVGALKLKATVGCLAGLVRGRQKKGEFVMRSLHSQERLHSECDGQVQARLRIFEVEAADLPDPVQPVAERVGVDA